MTTRRDLLRGGAALLAGAALPAAAQAQQRAPLGFHNAPAAGLDREPMRLVQGRAPAGLSGTLFRNGPAQFRRGDATIGHWFDGDGFVRAFRISEGQCTLSGRFVDTVKRRRDAEAGTFVMPGFGTPAAPGAPVSSPDDANGASTALLSVQDQLWALWEGGSPYAIDPSDLSTRGPVTLRDDLAEMPFSAHPKVSPDGTIWNFGPGFGQPAAFLWALAPDGRVKASGLIKLPRASYLHDWAVTATKLILPLQPWVVGRYSPPFAQSLAWRPELDLQVLVIDKADFTKQKLYDLPAGAFFHTADAYEEADGTIRFDLCLSEEPVLDADRGASILRGVPRTGPEVKMSMAVLRPDGSADLIKTPYTAEFPVIDQRLRSQPRGDVYCVTEGAVRPPWGHPYNALMRFNWQTGKRTSFDFGANTLAEEPIFVPKPGTADGGWLLAPTLNLKASATQLHVFDAQRINDGPLATWQSSTPLPLSFHGLWVGA
ncbi:MAG: carotenoid oxygenase family protein [Pseudomonadota bacterium]